MAFRWYKLQYIQHRMVLRFHNLISIYFNNVCVSMQSSAEGIYPPNKYRWVPRGNKMGLNMVPMWYSPIGSLVRLLKVNSWDLNGLQDEGAQKGAMWGRHGFLYGIYVS